MNSALRQPDATDSGSPRCIILWDRYEIQYELTQPDPSHWAAVGVVTTEQDAGSSGKTSVLVVGTGSTEEEAICDLRSRIMEHLPMPPAMLDMFAVDWTPTGV